MESHAHRVERRATYSALSGTFALAFALFNLATARSRKPVQLKPLDLLMLGFTAYRTGRMVAYDKVFETYRSFFAETVPDRSGAGESVEPKRKSGLHQALGELLSCPICSGTWISAALVYGLALAPRPTRVFVAIMSTIGVAELLNALTEALSWFGQASRDEAGLIEEGGLRPDRTANTRLRAVAGDSRRSGDRPQRTATS